MQRFLKYLLITMASILSLTAIALAILVYTFDPNDYKPLLIKLVQEKTHRNLEIGDEIKLTFWPKLGADLSTVKLSEPNSNTNFIAADKISLYVAVKPLLQKQVIVDTIGLVGARANIVTFGDGHHNFDDLLALADTEEDSDDKLQLHINGLEIHRAELGVINQQTNQNLRLSQLDLSTGSIVPGRPVFLRSQFDIQSNQPQMKAHTSIEGTLNIDAPHKTYKAQELILQFQGQLADMTIKSLKLTTHGQASALPDSDKLKAAGDLQLQLAGQMAGLTIKELNLSAKVQTTPLPNSDKLKASGDLQLQLSAGKEARAYGVKLTTPFQANLDTGLYQFAKLVSEIQIKDATLPNGALTAHLNMNGEVNTKTENIDARIKAQVYSHHLDGKVGLSHFGNSSYRFDLNIDQLDMDKYIKKDPNKAPEPIDLTALSTLDAAGTLRIGQFKMSNVKASNVKLNVKAKNGQLNLMPSANLYDGTTDGSVTVQTTAVPVLNIQQKLNRVRLGDLLKDAINFTTFSGTGSLNVAVNTAGNTAAQFKQKLNGQTTIQITDGAIQGFDLAENYRNLKDKINIFKQKPPSENIKNNVRKKTDFSTMTASFQIQNGVAHNQDLDMKSPFFRIAGNGAIDIANEKLDYLLKPSLVASMKGQGGSDLKDLIGVTLPVRITGTFKQPEWHIDYKAMFESLTSSKLVKENIIAPVGNKAKELKSTLEDKANKTLGGATDNNKGGGAQDVLKKPLENLLKF